LSSLGSLQICKKESLVRNFHRRLAEHKPKGQLSGQCREFLWLFNSVLLYLQEFESMDHLSQELFEYLKSKRACRLLFAGSRLPTA